MIGSELLTNAGCILLLATLLWGYSVIRRDVSIIDPWWSVFFLMVTVRTGWHTGLSPGKWLLMLCVALWSLRLATHLGWRCWKSQAEDPRYQAFRKRFGAHRYWWISFFQVFLLQGTLAFLITMPLQVASAASLPDPITPLDLIGCSLFGIGFLCEAVADAQLARHRRHEATRGTVLQTGLWRYSRHPNYFGEALLHWGLWLMCAGTPLGLACVFAPILLTILLLRVSGVSMLEPLLKRTKPGYDAYIRNTSAFIPWKPRTPQK